MSDYTRVFNKNTGDTINAGDFNTEFASIATASATKYDKGVLLSSYAGGALTSDTVDTPSGNANSDFTGIPSWVKRITVQLDQISLSTTAAIGLQLGTGGSPTTTGYERTSGTADTSIGFSSGAANWRISTDSTGSVESNGHAVITNITGNVWLLHGVVGIGGDIYLSGGRIALGGALDNLRVLAESGTFDNGSINIIYE